MSKISLLKEEIKVLDFINTLQNKINEITYVDASFEEIMEKHFIKLTSNITEAEQTRLRIILLNLEELNLLEGDVLKSPRITEEGLKLLAYHKEREKILYGICGGIIIYSGLIFIAKTLKIIK